MIILLTNDDGIEAPGLRALWETANAHLPPTAKLVVVAPDRCRSECGHSVTTGRPLRVNEVRSDWYSVDGTPVDCVRVGLKALAKDATMVLSGVNAGANLGIDLLVSGTFAAARESAIENVPAMAISHYRRPDVPATWDHVSEWMGETLVEFWQRMSAGERSAPLWNVNLPAIDPSTNRNPERVRCEIDCSPMKRQANRLDDDVSFASDFHARPRTQGRDVDNCFGGSITISEIRPPFLGIN